ncbi:MAG: hypothetical protein PHH26_00720 [Candidatus Thermoplasmatota archaeon]|nr:hypothetical protein [Candidatus Thermoplasmatota archaeon]
MKKVYLNLLAAALAALVVVFLVFFSVGCKEKNTTDPTPDGTATVRDSNGVLVLMSSFDPNAADITVAMPEGDSFNEPDYLYVTIIGKTDNLAIYYYYKCPCGYSVKAEGYSADGFDTSVSCNKCGLQCPVVNIHKGL